MCTIGAAVGPRPHAAAPIIRRGEPLSEAERQRLVAQGCEVVEVRGVTVQVPDHSLAHQGAEPGWEADAWYPADEDWRPQEGELIAAVVESGRAEFVALGVYHPSGVLCYSGPEPWGRRPMPAALIAPLAPVRQFMGPAAI